MNHMMAEKIRILIADDHAMVRKNICTLIKTQADMEVIATAENGREAVLLAEQMEPDVIVMDIYMPLMDGIEATKKIRAADKLVSIVILSMHASYVLVEKMLGLGAQGYVLKYHAIQDLPQAIRSIRQGKTFLSPALSSSS
jgi:two-component system, NarL family, response regulator NreC